MGSTKKRAGRGTDRAGSGAAHAQVLDWSPADCYLVFTLVNHAGNSSRKHSSQITKQVGDFALPAVRAIPPQRVGCLDPGSD